jgi:AmpE protein
MTIIAILLAFGLCHFVREFGRFRKRQWLTGWVDFSNDAFGKLPLWQESLGALVVIGVPLLALLLLNQALISALGTTGSFLLALAVLIYSFGPRDLDTDIAEIIDSDDGEERDAAITNLLRKPIPTDPEVARAAAVEAVFREALRRWFGIIFWFAVLGIAGAFLYRLIDWLVHENHNLTGDQLGLFTRFQQVMDWPAAQLMTLSLAIATDFDSVFAAWKRYHDEQGHGLFEGDNGFLLSSACRIVLTGHAARDGYADDITGPLVCLQQAMDLTWRILGVWLTVLALLLLIGVIV